MFGFQGKNTREQAPPFRGGMIKGKGNGTSDDVKKTVADGSYIMPADSTGAIGADALSGMGADVPINASNGEYELPPGQVHAVGVQALDQMRNATHTNVAQPKIGMGKGKQLFFANGGVVRKPEEESATYRAGAQMRDNVKSIGDGVENAVGHVADASKVLGRAMTEPYRAYGDFYNGLMGNESQAAQASRLSSQSAAPTQATGTMPLQSNQSDVRLGMPNSGAVRNSQSTSNQQSPLQAAAERKAATEVYRPDAREAAQKAVLPKDSAGVSFAPQGMGTAASGLVERYDAQRPMVASFGTGKEDVTQTAAWRAASKPHAGAQNGQLTANQINAMRGMLADADRNTTSLQQAAMNNAAAANRDANSQQAMLMRDTMNNAASLQRAGMQEQSNNARFDAQQQFAREQQAQANVGDELKNRAAGLDVRQAERMEDLRQRYLSAQPNEQGAIAAQIRGLSGQAQPQEQLKDNVIKVKVPVTDANGNQIGDREDVVDIRTGRSIMNQGGQSRTPNADALNYLKKNPDAASYFDELYGQGAAARALGQK